MVNFPYGQKGKILISYKTNKDFKNASLIISDNYVDIGSFNKEENSQQYNEFIKENFIEIPLVCKSISIKEVVVGQNTEGTLSLEWDMLKGTLMVLCNNIKSEISIPSNFKGFNYAGIVIPKGSNQQFLIKEFIEESKTAWLDTGIIY